MNWETKFSVQAALLALGLLLAIPFVGGLVGIELTAQLRWLQRVTEDHFLREITGYLGLALALVQVVLSLRKRLEWNFPGPSFPAWRGFHILAGVGFLMVVVIHTGGRLGWNLNGWLQFVFVMTVFIGLLGKVWETKLLARALPVTLPRPARRFAVVQGQTGKAPPLVSRATSSTVSQVRSKVNQARNIWLGAHIVLTAAFLTLLGFHVFSVYYF